MVNVLLLGSCLDTGGAERVIANITRYADATRFRMLPCHLIQKRGAIGDELVRDGHEVVNVGRSEGLLRYLSFRSLARVVREQQIDVIHSHTHYALSDAALCTIAMGRRVKVVHTFHFGNYPHVPARYRLLEGVASRVPDRLVAVGIEQAKAVRSTYWLRDVEVIGNGVEARTAAVDTEWQEKLSSRRAVVIGTICTLIQQKGLPDLLRVASMLKQAGVNAVFVVVGDGELRRPIEEQCAALGLSDTVLFTGWKTSASTTMLPLFDVFFQPSLWEAMSMVVLEAMAAAKPVVATDVGDNRHVVVDAQTGFIVQRGDVDGMADRLRCLVDSTDLRHRMGVAGQARHEAHYTVDAMVRRYERLYLDVVGDSRTDTEGEIECRCES